MEIEARLSDFHKVLEEAFARVDERVVGKWVKGTAEALCEWNLAYAPEVGGILRVKKKGVNNLQFRAG